MNDEHTQTVVVLGAGASRAVSYANKGGCPSPLDADFFDLLQRSEPAAADRPAVERILKEVRSLPSEHWRSLERSFYTLQSRAYMRDKLTGSQSAPSDAVVIKNFARCVQSLLRTAHGKGTCKHHQALLAPLGGQDAIISFNYDLVAERALRPIADERDIAFSQEIYSFGKAWKANLPSVLKLHGSSNWKFTKDGKQLVSRTHSWDDFDETPGYRGHIGSGSSFPIFLPFWDKRIEQQPWLDLWTKAYHTLRMASRLLVWGYSLPPTDIKAQSLFTLALGKKVIDLCVIDPSPSTRERWRQMLPRARYWEYDSIKDFFQETPGWWPEA
jgi:hypothetical protein